MKALCYLSRTLNKDFYLLSIGERTYGTRPLALLFIDDVTDLLDAADCVTAQKMSGDDMLPLNVTIEVMR